MRWSPALFLACAALCGACGDDGKPSPDGGAPAGSAVAAASATASARVTASAAAAAEDAAQVELQRFTLTSAVKDKEPSDKLDAAKSGTRVYGHLAVRNRTSGARRVSLSFRVNGDERSMVDLNVEKSWSWRTWAYVTLRKDEKGELTVIAFDDRGAELGKKTIPIR